MAIYKGLHLTLRDHQNRTVVGSFYLDAEHGVTGLTPATNASDAGPGYDPKGATTFVVAVVLVYALSIVFLIASHVFHKNRDSDGHELDKQVTFFLTKAPELKERSFRESYKSLKTSLIPVIAAGPAKDLVSRRKSWLPFLDDFRTAYVAKKEQQQQQQSRMSDICEEEDESEHSASVHEAESGLKMAVPSAATPANSRGSSIRDDAASCHSIPDSTACNSATRYRLVAPTTPTVVSRDSAFVDMTDGDQQQPQQQPPQEDSPTPSVGDLPAICLSVCPPQIRTAHQHRMERLSRARDSRMGRGFEASPLGQGPAPFLQPGTRSPPSPRPGLAVPVPPRTELTGAPSALSGKTRRMAETPLGRPTSVRALSPFAEGTYANRMTYPDTALPPLPKTSRPASPGFPALTGTRTAVREELEHITCL